MSNKKNGTVTFTPEELATTFVRYRTQLLQLPIFALQELLKHTSIRTGIRYKEVVSQIGGNFEMGNYDDEKLGEDGVTIKGRTFETFFGNCVEPIKPNEIYQSIWGSDITKGDGLEKVPITLEVASYIVKKIWENVLMNSFTAKHDSSDKKSTAKWFNGFKTIIDNDIAGTNERREVLISKELGNLQTGTDSITEQNAEDLIKDFYWASDEKLRRQKLKLFISDIGYHHYTEAYQTAHGALPYNLSYDKKTLDGASNVEFVPLSFVPKDFMILTPKNNIFCLFNQKTADEKYLIEKSLKSHYHVDVIANAFFGTQFEQVDKEMLSVWEKNPS